MKTLLRAILAICLAAGSPLYAHAPKEGDIWATAGPYVQRTQSAAKEPPRWGGGIAAEGDVDYNGGVEIAMLYMDKLYTRRQGGDFLAEQIKRMYITTGYRHWFVPWLSAGLAVYSAYSMGDVTVVTDRRVANPYLQTSAHDITEYGSDFSVQAQLWGSDWLAVVMDARYALSLTRKTREDANSFGVLLGVQYLVPKQGPAHRAGNGSGVIPP